MSSKLQQEISDLTECSICMERIRDPRTLPCMHTFCLKCLQELGKDMGLADEGNCPICRRAFTLPAGGFESLPVNLFINKLIDISHLSIDEDLNGSCSDQACDMCLQIDGHKPAVVYCLECEENLCDACLRRHKITKALKSHKTVSLKDMPDRSSSSDEVPRISGNVCTKHSGQEIYLYCIDCETPACVICYAAKHKEHKCADVIDLSVEIRKDVDKHCETVNICMKETEELMKQIELSKEDCSRQAQVTVDAVTRRYEELKALLDAQSGKLIEEIRDKRVRREKELETLREESEHELLTMKSFERHWSELKERGSACDIVQALDNLKSRIEDLVLPHRNKQSYRIGISEPKSFNLIFIPSSTTAFENSNNMLGRLEESCRSVQLKKSISTTSHNNFMTLLNKATERLVFTTQEHVNGLALHGNELFLVRWESENVEVYNLKNLTYMSRRIPVKGMKSAAGLVYNAADNCLYASNFANPSYIHKINLSDNSQTGWGVQNCYPGGLAISNRHTILVSSSRTIDEYDTSGKLMRSIQPVGEIIRIKQAKELKTGQFVMCSLHRPGYLWSEHHVTLIDSSGNVIRTCRQGHEAVVGLLSSPSHVVVDELGNLLFADSYSNKLVVLDSALQLIGDFSCAGIEVKGPTCLCWDEMNGRLFVVDSGKIISIEANLEKALP